MTLSHEEVERALIPAVKRGAMVSLTAGTVTGPRHVDGQIVDGPTGPVGQEGYVLNVDGHRYWLPFDAAVPWTIPDRQITIGPDGDQQPTLELHRNRPSYLAGARMYLAANNATTELAWAIRGDGVTQATLRLTKNGLLLQDNASGQTRTFAFDDDTGWITVPLLSGFTGTLEYRIRGGETRWSGRVTRTAGAFPSSWTQIATIPAAAIPSRSGEYTISGRNPVGAMQCDIYSSGVLRVSGTGTSTEAIFTGLSWL